MYNYYLYALVFNMGLKVIMLFLQFPINIPKFNGFIILLFFRSLEKKKRVVKSEIFQKFYILSKI